MVTVQGRQLICAFVFEYAKSRFSHEAAHIMGVKIVNLHAYFNIALVWSLLELRIFEIVLLLIITLLHVFC